MFIYTGLSVFFFNDTATTEIYTLSLHDALPIYPRRRAGPVQDAKFGPAVARGSLYRGLRLRLPGGGALLSHPGGTEDRKSTRLNSSHANISYAVFCLKKKNNMSIATNTPETQTC